MAQHPTNTAGYLSHEEWMAFEGQLETAISVCKQLATEMHFHEIHDSRWPTAGIQNKKWFRQWRVRIALNPDYLRDKQANYQLSLHKCIYVPFLMIYSSLSYVVVKKYSVTEIQDRTQLKTDIESIIKASD